MCVFSLKFLSQNYNTLKGETHRHEKAVPCPRGFLAISARAGGAVRLQQKAASLHSALDTKGSLLELLFCLFTTVKPSSEASAEI